MGIEDRGDDASDEQHVPGYGEQLLGSVARYGGLVEPPAQSNWKLDPSLTEAYSHPGADIDLRVIDMSKGDTTFQELATRLGALGNEDAHRITILHPGESGGEIRPDVLAGVLLPPPDQPNEQPEIRPDQQ